MDSVGPAIAAMLMFGLFTHMACGSTYALVPFIDRKAQGGVAGIVGAGGNVGAVATGFLLKFTGNVPEALFILGWVVLGCAVCAATVRFTAKHKQAEQALYAQAMAQRQGMPASAAALAAE